MRACANGERRTAAWPAFGDRVEVVDEAALAAEQRLVLETRERPADPWLRGGLGSHAPTLVLLLSPCGRASRRSPRAARGCSRRDDEPGRRARDASPSCRIATSGSPGSTSIASSARAPRRRFSRRARRPSRSRRSSPRCSRAGREASLRRAPTTRRARRVREVAPEAEEDALARCIWVARGVPEPRGLVVVVSAGTSDGPIVREARIRAELLGTTVVVHEDVGVAGVHRLAHGAARPRARRLRGRRRGHGRRAREPRRRARARPGDRRARRVSATARRTVGRRR